ncbi:MAG TPA: hypothetical protein VFA32_00160 [Dehalococcoidia bacterium]|nr:hypothetical protein [Dehalococcoidia bacterium]
MKIELLRTSRPILASLLLICWFFGSACFNISTQDVSDPDRRPAGQSQGVSDPDASAQESIGYVFATDQELIRGRDDEPTFPSRPDLGSGPPSPAGVDTDSTEASADTSQNPDSSSDEALVLGDPPEQRVTRINSEPLPQDWLPRQSSNAGLLESKTMISIMAVLLVLMIVSGIGVVRNW